MTYRKVLPSGIVITSTAPEHAEQLETLQDIVYPTLAETQRLKRANYLKHIEIFPEGQFVALDGDKVVGMTTSIRLTGKFLENDPSFDSIIEGGFCTSHDPEGEWLYGVDVGTHPDYRGLGIARALYSARQETCRALGLKGQYTMGMPNGYASVREQYSIDEYYDKLLSGEINDPTVSMQRAVGFEPAGLLKNYFDDPTCGNAGVRLILSTGKDV